MSPSPASGPTSLGSLGGELLEEARRSPDGRSAHLLHEGDEGELRQVLVALRSGEPLAHDGGPVESALLVVRGVLQVAAGEASWELSEGDHLVLGPTTSGEASALVDSVVLLTSGALRGRGAGPEEPVLDQGGGRAPWTL